MGIREKKFKVEVTLGEFTFDESDIVEDIQYRVKEIVRERVVKAIREEVDAALVPYRKQITATIKDRLDSCFQNAVDAARDLDDEAIAGILLAQLGVAE